MFSVRARAKNTGQIISNTAMVNGSSVILRLPPEAMPYELELSPAGKAQVTPSVYSNCDTALALLPTIDVDVSQLDTEAKADAVIPVELPVLPKPVNYQGTVDLCPNAGAAPDMLPMTLKTSMVTFANSTKLVRGAFEASATAMYDKATQQYNFCSWILPGDYVVKITPPSNINCEIFAERRVLMPDDNNQLPDAELTLRTPAMLSARIETPDGMPMANASIDLAALGIAGVTLADDDRSVTTYNRSRQATSGMDGMFTMPADVGAYDLIIKPPAQSNFAWKVIYDVEVASRALKASNSFMLEAPVLLTGTLRYYDSNKTEVQATLGSADVHAYTVVDDDSGNPRSVEIGRTQADQDGKVMLPVSPDLQHKWVPLL
jgi:hypothetical protein